MEKFIKQIARKAGDASLKLFGKVGVAYSKSRHAADVVTEADLLSEKIIVSAIKKKYPGHGIISEESGYHMANADNLWIIDPIDGTMNFASGIPFWGVMVLFARQRKPLYSAIYLPALGEFYFAKDAGGAYLNGRRIGCSAARDLDGSKGCLSSSIGRRTLRLHSGVLKGMGMHSSLACYASAAVTGSFVAAGRRDWVINFYQHVWDNAPVCLLLKEAGCKTTDFSGRPWEIGKKELVTANKNLHPKLLKMLRKIKF